MCVYLKATASREDSCRKDLLSHLCAYGFSSRFAKRCRAQLRDVAGGPSTQKEFLLKVAAIFSSVKIAQQYLSRKSRQSVYVEIFSLIRARCQLYKDSAYAFQCRME